MSEEIPSLNPEFRNQEKPPHIFFMSAARGTYDSLRSVQSTLSSEFGSDNVTVINSSLFGDKAAPDRFKSLGASLKSKIQQGPTTILAHSYGAVETIEAFKEIEKEDPDFFKKKENMDNINMVLISPAGFFKNWRQGLKYAAKYAKLGSQEAGQLKRTFPGKTSILQGIVSTSVISPTEMNRDQVVQGIRKISGKLSQSDGIATEIDALPDRDYTQFIDTKTLAKIRDIDARIAEATRPDHMTTKETKAARKALRQRGRLTTKVVNEAFMQAHAASFGDSRIPHQEYRKNRAATATKRRMLLDTFIRGKVLDKMTEFRDAGMKINIVIPEQDTMMSLYDARKFLQGDNDRLVVTPLSTHSAPWAPQPRILAELAKAFEKSGQETFE